MNLCTDRKVVVGYGPNTDKWSILVGAFWLAWMSWAEFLFPYCMTMTVIEGGEQYNILALNQNKP